ncbi:hypothetical protein HPP92_019468 [Vanilla planifolia]|uniref:DUF4378 domain-containing protein n=1 Tax=Vanilla planifolia TaxID=51239 RepID=A0A835Q0M7_VANPL|nr:hypothetical protein HPP92_019468 [Vanilla planifolia]
MSENLFQAFTEENSELQKQIGCMTGFFHMFDRLHLVNGRRFNGHQNKRITSGSSIANNSKVGADKFGCSPQLVLESSRTSFSPSSCSSSFSSIDCSKSTPQEPPCFKQDTSSYRSLGNLPKLKVQEIDAPSTPVGIRIGVYNASPEHGQLSLDFRDVVKDSIIREPHGLLVKTSSKGEPKRPEMNHMNSPKLMQLSNSMEESYLTGVDGKCRPSLDLNESFRVLMKLKEAPWNFSEVSKPSRPSLEAKEAPFYRISCDSPRFSYDGREMSQNVADTRENGGPKSKFRDLPRLSLGSRESSMRTSNSPLKDFDGRSIMEWSSLPPFTQKESYIQKSAPNVVAKLMGLETMPTLKPSTRRQLANMKDDGIKKVSTSTNQRGSSLTSKSLYSSRGELPTLSSQRSSHQDLTKLWQKNPNAVMKPSNIPGAPLEPAPWKHEEKLRVTQNKFSNRRSRSKQHPETVYSETERRPKELEFHHSNKDLRALKQIMNAMHAKGLLKPKKNGEHSPKIPCINSNGHVLAHGIQSPPSVNVCKPALPASAKTSSTARAAESPIVIMKSAKSINKNDVSTSLIIPLQDLTDGLRKLRTSELMDNKKVHGGDSSKLAKDHTPKTSPRLINKAEDNVQKGRLRTIHASPRPQQLREGNVSAVKSSKSVSPRLQQTNTEIEVRTRSPVLSSDSTNHQKFSTSKQLCESASPKNKLRSQANRIRGKDDKLSSCRESWKFIQQRDEKNHASDSYMSSASQLDVEVMSGNTLAHVNFASFQQGIQSCTIGTPLTLKDSPFSLSAEASTLAMAGEVPEQPSPISVLDATFCHDDLPASAVKKSSNFSKGENLPNSVDLCESCKIGSGINQKKLETVDKLLQKLKELNPTTATVSNADNTALLCESPKTDHRYISEILLASGLLMKDLIAVPKGLMSLKIHPSRYPINPDLFLVLEQSKTSEPTKYENIPGRKQLQHDLHVDKMHRKLVFDVINEVLVEKLELTFSSFRPYLSPQAMKLKGKLPSGQLLLKELCSEIDRLHAEGLKAESWDDEDKLTCEVLRDSVGWNDHRIELPGIVLDVERWIFKDLIDDVLSGELCGVHHRCSRRRRQLFAK